MDRPVENIMPPARLEEGQWQCLCEKV